MDVQVEYLGIHSPDYFPGYGTAFTPFSHSTYGVGSTLRTALKDALESVAQDIHQPDEQSLDGEVQEFIASHNMTRFVCANGTGCCEQINDGECLESDHDSCDVLYHVGIRWNS